MAGPVKVAALRPFYDRQERASRAEGEEFEATPARVRQLNACGPEQGGAPLVKELAKRRAPEEA